MGGSYHGMYYNNHNHRKCSEISIGASFLCFDLFYYSSKNVVHLTYTHYQFSYWYFSWDLISDLLTVY